MHSTRSAPALPPAHSVTVLSCALVLVVIHVMSIPGACVEQPLSLRKLLLCVRVGARARRRPLRFQSNVQFATMEQVKMGGEVAGGLMTAETWAACKGGFAQVSSVQCSTKAMATLHPIDELDSWHVMSKHKH